MCSKRKENAKDVFVGLLVIFKVIKQYIGRKMRFREWVLNKDGCTP